MTKLTNDAKSDSKIEAQIAANFDKIKFPDDEDSSMSAFLQSDDVILSFVRKSQDLAAQKVVSAELPHSLHASTTETQPMLVVKDAFPGNPDATLEFFQKTLRKEQSSSLLQDTASPSPDTSNALPKIVPLRALRTLTYSQLRSLKAAHPFVFVDDRVVMRAVRHLGAWTKHSGAVGPIRIDLKKAALKLKKKIRPQTQQQQENKQKKIGVRGGGILKAMQNEHRYPIHVRSNVAMSSVSLGSASKQPHAVIRENALYLANLLRRQFTLRSIYIRFPAKKNSILYYDNSTD